jgi:nucleoside-diphosphate-sugar epimerase
MSDLEVLFVGGSGVISSACSRLAVERGIELSVLNRGSTTQRPLPAGAAVLRGDSRDPASVREALGDREFDAVVAWVAFTPEQVQADIDLLRGRTGQYVFISSASAYQTPPARVPGSWSQRPCATRSGATRVTRSPARTCWQPPTATTDSRPRSWALAYL